MDKPAPEEIRRRKQRNLAIGGALLLFMAVVYAVTILKISGAGQ
jgi:hypothetical protein